MKKSSQSATSPKGGVCMRKQIKSSISTTDTEHSREKSFRWIVMQENAILELMCGVWISRAFN